MCYPTPILSPQWGPKSLLCQSIFLFQKFFSLHVNLNYANYNQKTVLLIKTQFLLDSGIPVHLTSSTGDIAKWQHDMYVHCLVMYKQTS